MRSARSKAPACAAKSAGLAAALFEQSASPQLLLTAARRIANVNAAYLQATGCSRMIVGRTLAASLPIGSPSLHLLRASLNKVLRTKTADTIARLSLDQKRSPDAPGGLQPRHWRASLTPIVEDGFVCFVLVQLIEVSDRYAPALKTAPAGREAERSLWQGFDRSPGFLCVLHGPDHVIEYANEACASLLGRRGLEGLPLGIAVPEFQRQGVLQILEQVARTGRPLVGRSMAIHVQRDPTGPCVPCFVDVAYQPLTDCDGRVTGIMVQGCDVTQAERGAQARRELIDELNHRVKNTLATVLSIATQTARSASDLPEFMDAFQSRVAALAAAHDALARGHWEGADLHEIVEQEFRACAPERVCMAGPHVSLSATASVTIGLCLHELAGNARRFGALSNGNGRVELRWQLVGAEEPELRIDWREIGGPPVAPPARAGFGSRLIQRTVAGSLDGEAMLRFAQTGVVCTITAPLSTIGAPTGRDD